jgi:peptidyl-prolyl cis-trans isomerase SurA
MTIDTRISKMFTISKRCCQRSFFLSASSILTYFLLNLSLTTPCHAQAGNEVIDRLLAVVGNDVILESEVYQNAQSIALQQNQQILKDPAKFAKLKEDVLNELINQKVLLEKAREDSVTVESREVDRELENRLQQIIQNVGSEQKLEEMYGYSIRRIRRDFRQTVEDGLLVERVKTNFLQDIKASRTEVERYFNDHPDQFQPMKDAVEIAHILLESGSTGMAEKRALKLADSLYYAIKNGAPFDSIAVKFSQDSTTLKNLGRIGWTQKGDLLSDFEDAAYSLQPGEVSKPVKTRYGFHIIKLLERKDEGILTSHILIKPIITNEDEQPLIDKLNVIREEILGGKSFADAAKEYSQDLESANKSGELGWFSLDEMPAEFKASISGLKVSDVSQPFKTQYGYHIVKILDHRDARPISLNQDWEVISQYATSSKREKIYNQWLEKLKSRYYIEIKS